MRLAAILLALLPATAAAQSCADHAALAAGLAAGWGETRKGIGLGARGSVVELWVNPRTGTWTLTETRPGAPTCLVESGEGWEAIPLPLDPDPPA